MPLTEKSIPVLEARKHFADCVNRAHYKQERVVLTRYNKPVAAMVPIADLELLAALEDRFDVQQARAALAEGGEPISLDQIVAELDL
jgi:prevent-host-death family protein